MTPLRSVFRFMLGLHTDEHKQMFTDFVNECAGGAKGLSAMIADEVKVEGAAVAA